MANPEISFETPKNEPAGYVRRFTIDKAVGALTFRFDGERADREFYLIVDREQEGREEIAYLMGQPTDLTDIMTLPPDELVGILEAIDYNEVKAPVPATV